MGSRSEFSPQTLAVLAALGGQPSAWQHGYALARETGLKSGTLYPILIRLAYRGLVEACWQDEPVPGRPRRAISGRCAGAPELAALGPQASPFSTSRSSALAMGKAVSCTCQGRAANPASSAPTVSGLSGSGGCQASLRTASGGSRFSVGR